MCLFAFIFTESCDVSSKNQQQKKDNQNSKVGGEMGDLPFW